MLFDDSDVTDPGGRLHARFIALGDLSGKTSDEIIGAIGIPSSRSLLSNGRRLLQWQACGYHIALVFDVSEKFVEISHEYANYQKYEPPRSKDVERIVFVLIAVLAVVLVLLAINK